MKETYQRDSLWDLLLVSHLKHFRGGDEEAKGGRQAGCKHTSRDEVKET